MARLGIAASLISQSVKESYKYGQGSRANQGLLLLRGSLTRRFALERATSPPRVPATVQIHALPEELRSLEEPV
jgi:hypothetical protein